MIVFQIIAAISVLVAALGLYNYFSNPDNIDTYQGERFAGLCMALFLSAAILFVDVILYAIIKLW